MIWQAPPVPSTSPRTQMQKVLPILIAIRKQLANYAHDTLHITHRIILHSFIHIRTLARRNRLLHRIKRKTLLYSLRADRDRSCEELKSTVAHKHLAYASALAMTGAKLSTTREEFMRALSYGRFSTDFDFFSPALSHAWFTEGSSNKLQELQRQALNQFPSAIPLAAEFAINCIELGNTDEAITFIENHPKKQEIEYERFLPLAHTISRKLPWAARYHKYGDAFEHLEENQRKFEDKIRRSSVCLVGNSPIERGRGRGQEIDSHDLVIRFNNFSTESKYQEDYGTKTDIWVKSCANDVLERKAPQVLTFILWEQDIWHSEYRWKLPEKLLSDVASGIPITYIPAKTHQELRKISDIQIPSTGLVTCFWIYRILGRIDSGSIFGFSMLDQISREKNKHYFSEHTNWKVGMHHDWIEERKVLDKILLGSL